MTMSKWGRNTGRMLIGALLMAATLEVAASRPIAAQQAPSLPAGYLGLQYNLLDQETAIGRDARPRSVQGVWGWQLNTLMALEARFGYGVADAKGGPRGARVTGDPQWLLGGYLKMGLSYRLPLSPYLLLGHSSVKQETRKGGVSRRDTLSDPSYGIGAALKLHERHALTVEWLQLDDDDNDLTTVNLGYLYRY